MHQGEGNTIAQLFPDRVVNSRISITQGDRSDGRIKIDLLVTVNIPYMGTQASLNVFRRNAVGKLPRAFGECLRYGHLYFLRTFI
jgi:hypothetical protein